MTYHEIGIQALSPSQHSKLRNGHRVRVKFGNHHKIHVSEEQHKKIHKAHAKGSAHTNKKCTNQEVVGWIHLKILEI